MATLDLRTTLLIATLLSFLQVGVLALIHRASPRYRGPERWVAGKLLLSLTFASVVVRGPHPAGLWVLGADLAGQAGLLLMVDGVARFLGVAWRWWYALLVTALYIPPLLHVTFVSPDLTARTILFSLFVAATMLQSTWMLLRRAPPGLRPSAFIAAGACAWMVAANAVRVVVLAVDPLAARIETAPAQELYALAAMLGDIGVTAGLAAMIGQRLLGERHAASEALARQVHYAEGLARSSQILLDQIGVAGDQRAVVAAALDPLRVAVGVSRAFVYRWKERPQGDMWPELLADTQAPGVPAFTQASPEQNNSVAPFVTARIGGGQAYGGPVDTHFSYDPVLRQHFDDNGMRASLMVPLVVAGRTWGHIGVADHTRAREWPEATVTMLRTAAEMIAAFLSASEAAEALRVSEAEQRLLALENARLYEEALVHAEQVGRLATTDPLTELPNRRHFFTRAAQELARARRAGEPLAVVLLDVDYFKQINDTYGHMTGDVALCVVAEMCRASVRPSDVVGRYGGEEFAVLLPGADALTAVAVAERVRLAIAARALDAGERPFRVTASLGVAVATRVADLDLDRLLAAADAALYAAKQQGRNRVVLSGEHAAMRGEDGRQSVA